MLIWTYKHLNCSEKIAKRNTLAAQVNNLLQKSDNNFFFVFFLQKCRFWGEASLQPTNFFETIESRHRVQWERGSFRTSYTFEQLFSKISFSIILFDDWISRLEVQKISLESSWFEGVSKIVPAGISGLHLLMLSDYARWENTKNLRLFHVFSNFGRCFDMQEYQFQNLNFSISKG